MTPVTYLFVPGDRPDRFLKAMASGADRIILDLEDAVRPEAKAAAREAIIAAKVDPQRVIVRINPVETPFYDDDLEVLRRTECAGVMLPKAESGAQVNSLVSAIARPLEVVPQIETAMGLDQIDTILTASSVERVAFGHLDVAVDLAIAPEWEPLSFVRQQIVWRSRLCDRKPPIDSVTPEISEEAVAADVTRAKKFGFGAKLLIHPAQVQPTRVAFAPSEDEVRWAERVLEALSASDGGAVSVDGRDPPPPEWSSAMFRKMEETHGKQATEARRDCHEVTAG